MAREDAQASHDVTQMALDALSADLAMEGMADLYKKQKKLSN